ncbi:40S ribosomal protein S5-1 [Hordeum vulgare]|nr:40S ribosomal protein S5-1 [Hordeum vulgare]
MHERMLHIRDVEGPKKTGSMETRLEAMEQQVFKCQGMVERGLNANHMMITEFTNKHNIDANDIGKHLSRLYDRIDQLQAQIYDLKNQNCETLLSPSRAANPHRLPLAAETGAPPAAPSCAALAVLELEDDRASAAPLPAPNRRMGWPAPALRGTALRSS